MNDKTSTPLVEMLDIKVAFGVVHAVDGVSVDLHAGEVVGLVGDRGIRGLVVETALEVGEGEKEEGRGELKVQQAPPPQLTPAVHSVPSPR